MSWRHTHLGSRDFSEERSTLDLNEPGVLKGVAAKGSLNLAEHGMTPELKTYTQYY
jgi:hypothetical protein